MKGVSKLKIISNLKNSFEKSKTVSKVKDIKNSGEKKKEQIKAKKEELLTSSENIKKTIKESTPRSIFEVVSEMLLESFKFTLNDVSIVPGRHLIEPIKYCGLITMLSLGCYALDIPFFLDWRGALLGTLILISVVFIALKRKE